MALNLYGANPYGSIMVSGLQSASPFVTSFAVEVYADSALTQLLYRKSAVAFWDDTQKLATQYDTLIFSGLQMNNTYWLRAGTCSTHSTITSWSAPYSVQLANVENLEGITYGGTYTATPSGVSYQVRPSGAPSDIDHYEAIYTINTTIAPAINVHPIWRGVTDINGLLTFGSIGANGQVIRAYMRAVNTSGNYQPWTLISQNTVNSSTASGNLDGISDGTTYAKTLASGLKNGVPDPRQTTGFVKMGSVNPAWSGTVYWSASASSASAASVQFWWNQLVVKRVDGSQTVVGGLPQSAAVNVTGLSPSASSSSLMVYDFYPYIDDFSNVVEFLSNGNAGSPSFGWVDSSITQDQATTNSQQMNRQDRIGLGPIQITMPVYSGTTTTSGGGGGFGGTCPRSDMKVYIDKLGRVPASFIQPGDRLLTTPEYGDWVTVQAVREELWSEWLEINTNKGSVVVHPATSIPVADASEFVKAQDLTLSHILKSRFGLARVIGIKLLQEEYSRIILTCDGSKVFLCGRDYPNLVIHNTRLLNC